MKLSRSLSRPLQVSLVASLAESLVASLVASLLACAAPPRSPSPRAASPQASAGASARASSAASAEASSGASAGTWLELGGARMLVATTKVTPQPPPPALPLLVVLPWARSQPAAVLGELGYLDLPVAARVITLQPFEPDGDGFSWWRRTRPAPQPADPDRDDELLALLTDRSRRVAALLPLLQQHFATPASPVVTGVSQGGDLSIQLAVHHPSLISAALPIAARFPSPLWPASLIAASPIPSGPPLDAFHGSADPVAPLAALERAFAALRAAQLPAALHVIPDVQHEIAPALRAAVHACATQRLRGSRQPCR